MDIQFHDFNSNYYQLLIFVTVEKAGICICHYCRCRYFYRMYNVGSMNNLFKFNSVAIEKSLYDGDHVAMYSTVPYVREHCEEKMFSLNELLRYTVGCTTYVIAACTCLSLRIGLLWVAVVKWRVRPCENHIRLQSSVLSVSYIPDRLNWKWLSCSGMDRSDLALSHRHHVPHLSVGSPQRCTLTLSRPAVYATFLLLTSISCQLSGSPTWLLWRNDCASFSLPLVSRRGWCVLL